MAQQPDTTVQPDETVQSRGADAADGTRLRFDVRGPEGRPTVVLLHGFPDDRHVWDPVARLLADRFRVVVPDLRGMGESDAQGGPEAYRVEALVDDLATVIDAVAPGGSVHLVGHDWGSVIGWAAAVAATRPNGPRLASFVSVSGPELTATMHWRRWQGRAAWPQQLRSTYTLALRSRIVPAVLRGLARVPRPAGIGSRVGFADPRLLRSMAEGCGLYAANLSHSAISAARQRPVPRTRIPVTVVVARRDPYITPRLATDAARAVAGDPQVIELDTGHWVPTEAPERLARIITGHVGAVAGGAGVFDLRSSAGRPIHPRV